MEERRVRVRVRRAESLRKGNVDLTKDLEVDIRKLREALGLTIAGAAILLKESPDIVRRYEEVGVAEKDPAYRDKAVRAYSDWLYNKLRKQPRVVSNTELPEPVRRTPAPRQPYNKRAERRARDLLSED